MRLPKVENPDKLVGLYVVDYGDSCSVGFAAEEVAELLESRQFADSKVYKIHQAYPDGRMELRGVPAETFQLEMGMFFYADDSRQARQDYQRLVKLAIESAPPSRANVHLSKLDETIYVTALIYPAEYNDEFSAWLLEGDYKTEGPANGGIDAVTQYYERQSRIIEQHQLFSRNENTIKTGDELLVSAKLPVQRYA